MTRSEEGEPSPLSEGAARPAGFQLGSWPLRLGGILQALFTDRKTRSGVSCDYRRVFLGSEFRIELRGFSPSPSKQGSCFLGETALGPGSRAHLGRLWGS